jgi:hypothetical protein
MRSTEKNYYLDRNYVFVHYLFEYCRITNIFFKKIKYILFILIQFLRFDMKLESNSSSYFDKE